MKIAILGGQNSILGFKALGLEAFGVLTKEEGLSAIQNIKKSEDYGVLFVTEEWAETLEEELEDLSKHALPAIVTVPSQKGHSGAGLNNLRKIVERAIGSDILFKDS